MTWEDDDFPEPFKCAFCYADFNTFNELLRHLAEVKHTEGSVAVAREQLHYDSKPENQ